ncbi:MAG TPA: hypothetical protein VGL53_13130 [Bryobacteraceae bacterium]|jgi:hypothetical protein
MEKETAKESKVTPAKGKAPSVRTASKEQFKKAHSKTHAQHAGLFRRLAK